MSKDAGPSIILKRPAARSLDDATFLQERLAKAGLFTVLLFGAFALLRAVFQSDGSFGNLVEPSFAMHVGALAPLLTLWLVGRGRPRTFEFLCVLEIVTLTMGGALIVGMGAFMPLLMRPDLLVALVLTLLLTARAVYVPSSTRRTLLIGALLTPPFMAMVFVRFSDWSPNLLAEAGVVYGDTDVSSLRGVVTAFGTAWWLAALTMSVAATRVIYGLREEVLQVSRLGQYQLDEKIGEGGMGIIYRAHHASLQRPTAVKLLPPDRLGADDLARFEQEVRQTARLTHPNTVTIFDYGRTPDGIFYYAMELLDGVPLKDVVTSTGRMPPGRVIHVLRQAAASLAEAHGIGLVHRDIKPENIMLCQQGGVGDVVKVVDFGLVKQVSRTGASRLTHENTILGTPQYMAPEALRSPEDVDARADLYALGATAFLLLTGRDVFEATTIVELCGHHLHTEPTPPSKLVDGIPADLEAIVLSCLAKDPSDRPGSARSLGARLAACQDAGSWNEEDVTGWWTKHGTALARPGGVSTSADTVLVDALVTADTIAVSAGG